MLPHSRRCRFTSSLASMTTASAASMTRSQPAPKPVAPATSVCLAIKVFSSRRRDCPISSLRPLATPSLFCLGESGSIATLPHPLICARSLKPMHTPSWSSSTSGRSWFKTDLNSNSTSYLRSQAPNERYATVCSKVMTAAISTTAMILRLKTEREKNRPFNYIT